MRTGYGVRTKPNYDCYAVIASYSTGTVPYGYRYKRSLYHTGAGTLLVRTGTVQVRDEYYKLQVLSTEYGTFYAIGSVQYN